MSADLSFTSMMRPDTMLSAATRMMSERIRNMVLRSTSSASNRLELKSCQGSTRRLGPAARLIAGSSARSFSGSATMVSMLFTASPLLK